MAGTIRDGDIALKRSALTGADLWFEEKFIGWLFLTSRLVEPIDAAGFLDVFKPLVCRIVDDAAHG